MNNLSSQPREKQLDLETSLKPQEAEMIVPEPEFVTIGHILSPWGIQGKIKIEVITDFPQRFTPKSTVYINHKPMTIESTKWHKGRAIIKLNTISSIEEAQGLRGRALEIHRSQLKPLPEGQYYLFQVIGLEVRTTQGGTLGNVTEILTAESNDTYVVSSDTGEILIPAIEDVVKAINLDKGYMVIEPLEGLLSLNPKIHKK